MNSIRPFATLIVLAVIGVGLYLVINTSDPVPPEEAADAMLAIPEIEDDLAGFLEQGASPNFAGGPAASPVTAEADLSEAPAWSPPPAGTMPPSANASAPGGPVANGLRAAPALPEDPPSSPLPHSAAESLRQHAAAPPAASGTNAFSAQLRTQAESAAPAEITNPYAGPSAAQPFGDVPNADVARQMIEGSPTGTAGYTPYSQAFSQASPEPPADVTPITSTPFAAVRSAIDETLQRGDLSQALLMLSEFYADPQLTPEESEEVTGLLNQLAGTVIYSTQHVMEQPYRVQPGDSLAGVAARYGVTPELLAKINGIADPSQLPPGTELKVVRGPFHAIYDAQGLRLTLDGRYAGRFAVEGGSAWPVDSWTVREKTPSAAPGGAMGGAKQIILVPTDQAAPGGNAAIVTAAPPAGDTQPAIRVSAQDMNDLYDILTVGSRVTVRR